MAKLLTYNECIEYYRNNYETVVYDFALTNLATQPIYISGKLAKCRFCFGHIDLTDTQKKHAVSEFLGNENVFLQQECRDCNEKLSVYESTFSKYLMFERSLSGIKGKNGAPKFASRKSQFWISSYNNGIEVGFGKGAQINVDHEKRLVKLLAERPKYIPFHLYLSLLKYALSLMSEERLLPFRQAQLFIQRYGIGSILKPIMFESQVKSFRKAPLIRLLYRRPDCNDMRVPYGQIVLDIARYRFQTFIPSDRERTMNLGVVPYLTAQQSEPKVKDLSSKVESTGEQIPFTFQYFGPVFYPKPLPETRNGG